MIVAINPRFHRGQSTSLQAGVGELGEESAAALFLLCDQPLITPAIIDRIVTSYQHSPHPIVLPVSAGRRGNPVLFDRETFARIEQLREDTGARPGRLLRRSGRPVADVTKPVG